MEWLDFFDSKNNADDYSKGKKIQISISPLAKSILKSDGDIFFGPDVVAKNARTNKNPITYMVNTIIENFAYESEVNPDEYMSSRRQLYIDTFVEGFVDETKKKEMSAAEWKKRKQKLAEKTEINRLVNNAMIREKEAFAAKNVLPTYSGEKVYINAESIAILKNIGAEVIEIYKKPYKFVSALIEDYTKHTFSEREKIIRKEKFADISNAISRKMCLQVELGGKQYLIKPIEIVPDSRGNYLLCLSSRADECKYTVQAPRISNMKKVTKLTLDGQVTKEEQLEAYKFMKNNGIANVGNARNTYKVKMTEKGKEIYRRIVTKDVSVVKVEDDIYYIESSEYTMNFFLTSFGKEAVILDEDMKARYINFYKDALEAYEEA